MPSKPYTIRLTVRAPRKAEYFAIGPNVSTACDSISPGVSENKVWDASSGMNIELKKVREARDTAIAIAPPTSPTRKSEV